MVSWNLGVRLSIKVRDIFNLLHLLLVDLLLRCKVLRILASHVSRRNHSLLVLLLHELEMLDVLLKLVSSLEVSLYLCLRWLVHRLLSLN